MTTAALNFDALLPEGQSLYPYQTVGVAASCVLRRNFIADEQGLGKTIQALTTAEVLGTFPIVVVCPPSLKANWVREISLRFPHRSFVATTGRKPHSVEGYDFVIVTYPNIAGWADFLGTIGARGLIVDESHRCKDPKAQQSKAVRALAAQIPEGGIVLCLTGTPILNRPVELANQLAILGRLDDVVAPVRSETPWLADKDAEFVFKFRYCFNAAEKADKGRQSWDGAQNLPELHANLRATCFIRRDRSVVFPDFTDTIRQTTVLSLNGALKAYRSAEADLISYLRKTKGDEAAAKARNAKALVQINELLRLAGLAKVEAAVDYITNWLDSNEGKIVVFAKHVEVQQALVAAFDCPHILGGEGDIAEAQKALFNDGAARVIVCSLQAAREGHTLVANGTCADVLFVEQGWNPGTHGQAEDRINRIGRTAKSVFAQYLLADETIDGWLFDLIQTKGQVFDTLIRGGASEEQAEKSLQSEILAKLEERA